MTVPLEPQLLSIHPTVDYMVEPLAFESHQLDSSASYIENSTVAIHPRFTTGPGRDYVRQYANLYWFRLEKLKPIVIEAARAKWGDHRPSPPFVDKLLDVEPGMQCIITGTVYLEMPLKPNVLDELAEVRIAC